MPIEDTRDTFYPECYEISVLSNMAASLELFMLSIWCSNPLDKRIGLILICELS